MAYMISLALVCPYIRDRRHGCVLMETNFKVQVLQEGVDL